MRNPPNDQHELSMTMRDRVEEESRVWLGVISAVQYLSATARPGFTVSDAVAEAVQEALLVGQSETRWCELTISERDERIPTGELDPLLWSLQRLVAVSPSGLVGVPSTAVRLTASLRAWSLRMSEVFNDSAAWPHPVPEDGWELHPDAPPEAAG